MDRELVAKEERRRRLRNLQAMAAITLGAAGCYLLHFAWSIAQALPSPLNDALSTAVSSSTCSRSGRSRAWSSGLLRGS
jgi:hypothetical protein